MEPGEISTKRSRSHGERKRMDYADLVDYGTLPRLPLISDINVVERPVEMEDMELDLGYVGLGMWTVCRDDDDDEAKEERLRQERKRRRLAILEKYDVSTVMSRETSEIAVQHKTLQELALLRDKDDKKEVDDDMFATDYAEPIVHVMDDAFDMFASPQQRPPSPSMTQAKVLYREECDDAEGYYKHLLGEVLDQQYHVSGLVGKGVFSTVVRARDAQDGDVAIKIIRNNEVMHRAGLKEVSLLERLNKADPHGRKHIVLLKRWFEHRNHLCLVFENFSMNLRDVLKKFGSTTGLNLRGVRAYAQQLFLALSLLHKCNILHADIKPDNILVNEQCTTLKLCDLGSASDAKENDITPYLVSRYYRAPEIILGMPYDFSIDVWSAACTLYELYTGRILFPGRNNNDMLRLFMELKGRFNNKMLKRGEFTSQHFDEDNNFLRQDVDKLAADQVSIKVVSITKPLKDMRARLLKNTNELREGDKEMLLQFVDFLDRCLALSPDKRLTPKEALQHPFLKHSNAHFDKLNQ